MPRTIAAFKGPTSKGKREKGDGRERKGRGKRNKKVRKGREGKVAQNTTIEKHK